MTRQQRSLSVWFATLAAILSACNQPLKVSPPSKAQGYELTVVGGTANLGGPGAGAQQNLAERLSKLVTAQTGLSLSTQAGNVNLYVSLLKDGLPLDTASQLSLFRPGENKPYGPPLTLEAGRAWRLTGPVPANGPGSYTVTTKVGEQELGQTVEIDPSRLLAIPSGLKVSLAPDVLFASWSSVPEAAAYVAGLYDFAKRDYVWLGAVKTPGILLRGLSLAENTAYAFDLIAVSWDPTNPTTAPYPKPLPGRFDLSSLTSSRPASRAGAAVSERFIAVGARPGQVVSRSFSLSSSGAGALTYSVTLSGSSNIAVTTPTSGVLHGSEATTITVQATCPDTEADLTADLVIRSNAPDKPVIAVPVGVECGITYSASRLLDTSLSPLRALSLDFERETNRLLLAATNLQGSGNVQMSEAPQSAPAPLVNGLSDSLTAKFIDGSGKIGFINGSSLELADAQTGARSVPSSLEARPSQVAWSADGSRLAYSGNDMLWRFRDSKSGGLLPIPESRGHVAWSPDGSTIVTSSSAGIKVWETSTGRTLKEFKADCSFPNPCGGELAWRGGRTLALLGQPDATVEAFDLESGQVRLVLSRIYRGSKYAAAHPLRNWLAFATGNTLEVISLTSGRTVVSIDRNARFDDFSRFVIRMAWSRDGQYLAASTAGNGLEVYRIGSAP